MNLNPGSNTQESVIQDLNRRLGSSATFIRDFSDIKSSIRNTKDDFEKKSFVAIYF